jgi:hypothetical protein
MGWGHTTYMNKNTKRSEVKVGMEVTINGVWYQVAEVTNSEAWVTDQDGGDREFPLSVIAENISK